MKNAEALAMSMEQPKQEVFGQELYPSVFEKAAILGINIIKRRIFFNGNKRTGFVAMVQFLALAVKLSLDIAVDDSDFDKFKETISELLRKKSQPI